MIVYFFFPLSALFIYNMSHHSCERREHAFMVLRDYLIIFHIFFCLIPSFIMIVYFFFPLSALFIYNMSFNNGINGNPKTLDPNK